VRFRGDLDLAFWATAGLVTGPVLFWRGFRALRVRRLIQNTPTARIRSMAMGLVEINGTIEARSSVTAPFSGRPCAHWQVEIATRTNRRGGWTVVHRNASGNPFYLRDETGVAMVYPKGADCRIAHGVEEECLGISLPSCYSDYMAEQGLGLRHLWRLGAMRFRERMLEPGQRVYVLGSAMPRARVLTVSEGEALAATGTDDRSAQRLRSLDSEVVATVRQGENERTFIISQDSERSLTFLMGWKATAMVWGGPILTLAGLAYWLDRLSKGQLFR
jgi:hypothetical protein